MSTAAHAISELRDYLDPNIVKVVLTRGLALYFSRAPIPWLRRASAGQPALPQQPPALCAVGPYACPAAFCALPSLPPSPVEATEALEQLRALWHDSASPCVSESRRRAPGGYARGPGARAGAVPCRRRVSPAPNSAY